MKKLWAIVILIVVIAVAFLLLRTKHPAVGQPTAQNGISPENNSNAVFGGRDPTTHSTAAANLATNLATATSLAFRAASPNPLTEAASDTNEPSAWPPLTVLDKARVMIHNYHAAFGQNPVGTNLEIADVLQGKNPKQINFFAESGLRLNGKGEIVDGYGTPFFFHQISGQEMEIRCAGPDKVMWTSDDMVTR